MMLLTDLLALVPPGVAVTTSPLEFWWCVQGALCQSIATANYWDAASDTRDVLSRKVNGEVLHAAKDERQAELYRIIFAGAMLSAGIIVAHAPNAAGPAALTDGSYAQFLILVGMTMAGLSAVRARINRLVARRKATTALNYRGPERRARIGT